MSIVLTMMVRDGQDIVACNLAHHLSQGVAEVIVTDNGSVDGTRDLLAGLARSMPLTVIDEPPSDWSQGRWVDAHGAHGAAALPCPLGDQRRCRRVLHGTRLEPESGPRRRGRRL